MNEGDVIDFQQIEADIRNKVPDQIKMSVYAAKRHEDEMRKSIFSAIEMATVMAMQVKDESDKGHLEKLKNAVKEHIKVSMELDQYVEKVKGVERMVESRRVPDDFKMSFGDEDSEPVDEDAIEKTDLYKDFARSVGIIQDEDEDAEFIMEDSGGPSTTCPITQTTMEEPVKNSLCPHSYSKRAIETYLRRGRSNKCPVAGCNKVVKDLTRNIRMEVVIDTEKRGCSAAQASGIAVESDEDDGFVVG